MPNKFVKHFLSDRQLSVSDLNNRGLSLWKTQFIYAKPETHRHTQPPHLHTHLNVLCLKRQVLKALLVLSLITDCKK